MKPTQQRTSSPSRSPVAGDKSTEDAEVDAAERRVGSLLQDLEQDVGGEVKDLDLEEVVDTDAQGRPVLKKKVDIRLQPRKDKQWLR